MNKDNKINSHPLPAPRRFAPLEEEEEEGGVARSLEAGLQRMRRRRSVHN